MTICSWNTVALLEECLRSLDAVRGEVDFEVIVVDNASSDGSADRVEALFPWVRLLRQSTNLGFTGGQNLAMSQRSAPHVFLLNSDAKVHHGALSTLLQYHREHPNAGIIGPKVLNPDGTLQYSCRRFPNPVAALFRNTLLGRLFPKNRFTREYLMEDWAHDEARSVDWVSGAAMFASKGFIDKVGLMDPRFFMYCEDVDWCWRAHRAGFDVVYLPSAVVTHAIGKSSDQAANRMILRFHRSMLYFYRKNMLPQQPLPLRPVLYGLAVVGLLTRAGVFIVKNKLDKIKRALGR